MIKDKKGKTINVGDEAVTYATCSYAGIKVGHVIGFSPTRVYIKCGSTAPLLRKPSDLVIL